LLLIHLPYQEKHKEEMTRLYEESQTPEWMRPLKKLHQRRKSEQSEKEAAERRKAEEERQRFEAMPAWKKQLIFKKRAKSADNLLAERDVKNLNISETKREAESVNSECKTIEKPVENSEVNAESDAGANGVDLDKENGISDKEKCDEDTANQELQTSTDVIEKEDEEEKENGGVENTGDDSELAADLDGNEDYVEIDKIDDVGDTVSSEQKELSDEENGNHDESAVETPDSSGESDVSPAIPDDSEENLELDEDDESAEQQVEASSEPTEEENNNE
jgi:hypothetical protein